MDDLPFSEWQTPAFVRIRGKRTKRISPYSATEKWENAEEVKFILKYEEDERKKAAIMLLWDLDARNHEVTKLKIKNVRFKEKYAEGEVPFNTKTGGGAILLIHSLPYVRDWMNKHPRREDPD